jgi:unsaturated rhamnogalacturonyl hydrolase
MLENYFQQITSRFQPYKGGVWCYEDGILMNACYQYYQTTKKQAYLDFVINYYDAMIDEEGNIKNYQPEEYNIDNIAPGIVLFPLYQETKRKKYLFAIETLAKQLKKHPRTKEGNFWHKKRYPFQVWLDGIYMGLVFYTRYALFHQNQEILQDIQNQLKNVRKYLFDEKRKLYIHAYDEQKVMQWADKNTGQSPNLWSRSVGWLAMAFIEMYEDTKAPGIKAYLEELVRGAEQYLYEGMLWQIIDRPEVAGNYPETSGTMMLCYAYLKGARLGAIDNHYANLGREVFEATRKRYFYQNQEGYHLGGICEVAGLDNEKRNGSIAYYLSERVKADEVKGVAPFILAYSEILKLQ